LFDFFANEALGVLQGEWYFGSDTTQTNSGSFKGHKSKPKPKPKPKQKPAPKPKPKAKVKPTPDQGTLVGLNSIAPTAQVVVNPTSSSSIPVESTLVQSEIADLFVPTSATSEPPKSADALPPASSVWPQCSSLSEANLAVINMGALLQSERKIEAGSDTIVPTKK
jgi:outer membrane biosynthesis protein TonB